MSLLIHPPHCFLQMSLLIHPPHCFLHFSLTFVCHVLVLFLVSQLQQDNHYHYNHCHHHYHYHHHHHQYQYQGNFLQNLTHSHLMNHLCSSEASVSFLCALE